MVFMRPASSEHTQQQTRDETELNAMDGLKYDVLKYRI